jgi:hypothetical protein
MLGSPSRTTHGDPEEGAIYLDDKGALGRF